MKNGNGNQNSAEKKPKPKYSIHDFKPKKRYTREEKEMMEAGMRFLEALGRDLEKQKLNEQIEETVVG